MLLCFLPVFAGDYDSLLNNLVWVKQLGGCPDHDAVIVADAGMEARAVFALKDEASLSFKSVEIITTEESVQGWIAGANALFLTAARFAQTRNQSWLWMEPDAIPLKPGWISSIQIHYQATGAKYMGALVPCRDPRLPATHLAGVAVYPPSAYSEIGKEIEAYPDKAFDISTAPITVPQATESGLWCHLWGEMGNPPIFAEKRIQGTKTFDLDWIAPKSVLFHRNKGGSLIDLLRKRAGIVPKTFIQLGRYGDIVLLLPSLLHIFNTTGIRPRLVVANDYASVLDGVSYVEPVPLNVHWWGGMTQARKFSQDNFGNGTVTQCVSNEGWVKRPIQWTNFQCSMIDRTGVPLGLMNELPLVFDCRSPERESKHIPISIGKPYVVVNTSGISSPFKHCQKLIAALSKLRDRVAVVDIGTVRCHRIYDLLGVMDDAVGGIHIDSATLHLAHACPKPYIAFTQDGWLSSVPLGNCVMEVKYSQFDSAIGRVIKTVEEWL